MSSLHLFLKAFCWNSKSLVGLDDFPNISLVTLVCSWLFSLIGTVSHGAFPKETSDSFRMANPFALGGFIPTFDRTGKPKRVAS